MGWFVICLGVEWFCFFKRVIYKDKRSSVGGVRKVFCEGNIWRLFFFRLRRWKF